ncbi:MAG: electron transfer flavoprotein subunit beta/FixA family protein [Bdellovibrionaceae bacterium]|nr:electron transfer flavoprotein subunit beta/FixA family protein [Pseudobdellovibrionaceae bacterium]MBX3033673.1 electron transfer flavoprotein subunit beta/FixA family protein [Pseudobdellovibrionaceae bacterium]
MKIFVCIKQVPDTETKIKIAADKSGIDTAGVKWVMNPYDEYAVEEAVKLKEANAGAQVHVITAGPKTRAADVLRTALAMGADEGILINSPENLDAYATARALAETIRAEGGAQLVLTGKLAIDDNASSVSQMVAEFLGTPHATVVSKLTYTPESITVERDVEGGSKEISQLQLPALVAANKGLNMPRYASLPGIMKAKKKVLKEVEFASLNIPASDVKVKHTNFALPADKPPVKMLSGDSSQQAAELVKLLRDEAKVL